MPDVIRGGIEKWEEALTLMRSALRLLDDSEAPADVGAHLDLAIIRLEAAVAGIKKN
jgi:hypothetical protein